MLANPLFHCHLIELVLESFLRSIEVKRLFNLFLCFWRFLFVTLDSFADLVGSGSVTCVVVVLDPSTRLLSLIQRLQLFLSGSEIVELLLFGRRLRPGDRLLLFVYLVELNVPELLANLGEASWTRLHLRLCLRKGTHQPGLFDIATSYHYLALLRNLFLLLFHICYYLLLFVRHLASLRL